MSADLLSDEAFWEWYDYSEPSPSTIWKEARHRAREHYGQFIQEFNSLYDKQLVAESENKRLRDAIKGLLATNHLATAYTDRVKAVKAANVALEGK